MKFSFTCLLRFCLFWSLQHPFPIDTPFLLYVNLLNALFLTSGRNIFAVFFSLQFLLSSSSSSSATFPHSNIKGLFPSSDFSLFFILLLCFFSIGLQVEQAKMKGWLGCATVSVRFYIRDVTLWPRPEASQIIISSLIKGTPLFLYTIYCLLLLVLRAVVFMRVFL